MISLSQVKKVSPSEGEMMDIFAGELAWVKRPANKREYLLIKSREDMMDISEIIKSVESENETELLATLSEHGIDGEAANAVVAISRLGSAFDEIDNDLMAKALGVTVTENTNGDKENDVSKTDLSELPAHIRKAVESAMDENEELKDQVTNLAKAVAQQQDERILEKHRATASELTNLSEDTEDIAKCLKSVFDVDKESGENLLRILRSANEVAKTDGLYESKGSGGNGRRVPSSVEKAEEELESRAAELLKTSDEDMTMATAMERVLLEDKELRNAIYNA